MFKIHECTLHRNSGLEDPVVANTEVWAGSVFVVCDTIVGTATAAPLPTISLPTYKRPNIQLNVVVPVVLLYTYKRPSIQLNVVVLLVLL